jgi:hypothetical protein
MSISPLPANRLSHASASAVKQDNTAIIGKNEERSSWKNPVYYTALAVAGIGAAFFAYNSGALFGYFLGGIFSSSTPPPSPIPTPPAPSSTTPHPSSPSPTPDPSSTLLPEEDVLRDLIQNTIRQMAQDPTTSEEVKDWLNNPHYLVERFVDIWKQSANFNPIIRQDCPAPVPEYLSLKQISKDEKFEVWENIPINSYRKNPYKEECFQKTFNLWCVDDFGNRANCNIGDLNDALSDI